MAYNTIVGAAGLLTCATFLGLATVASSILNEPVEFPDPPLFAVFAVLLYGIAANVCYTDGWLVEWLAGKVWRERAGAFGEISFCVGLAFSVLLTLLPALVLTAILLIRLLLR